jgi:hypothetical protein
VLSRLPGDVIGQARMPGNPRFADRQPRLGRTPVALAQADADLREVLQEEVGEMLVGQHHACLHVGPASSIANDLQRPEKPVPLRPGSPLPAARGGKPGREPGVADPGPRDQLASTVPPGGWLA